MNFVTSNDNLNKGTAKPIIGEGEDNDEEVDWAIDDTTEEEDKTALLLIGKVWTCRILNSPALMDTLKKIWQPKYGVETRKIEENMYSFQFFHWRDKRRVLEGQPWHFDKHAICFSEIQDDGKPSDLQLHSMPIWTRFYNLPFKGRGIDDNIKTLANKVGVFVQIDKTQECAIDRSIRVKTIVDVRYPLKSQVKLKIRGGDTIPIPVKYERLPLFCYICGKIGHGDRDCDENKGDKSPERRFSNQLRASPWKVPPKNGEDEVRGKGMPRRLFFPKPSMEEVTAHNKQVGQVVEHMGGILIADEQGREDDTLRTNDGEREKNHLTHVDHTQKGQHNKDEPTPHKQTSAAKVGTGRTWLRINRPKISLEETHEGVEGGKRKSVWEIDKMESEERQGVERVSKKQCIETDTSECMEDDQMISVAGPTDWALGCQ